MIYVLQRVEDGKYVTPPGTGSESYTDKLQNARFFPSREAAEKDRCGNEVIVEVIAK